MKPIRIGIVGAGANTRLKHIPNLQKIPEVEIVSVANRSRESSEQVAQEFKIAKVYDRWQDLVAANDTDAIVIGTWPYRHGPVTLAALKANKHVLCEARMAMNLAEAKKMLAASKKKSRLVCQIVPSPLTLKVDQTIQELIQNNFLGEIRAIELWGNQPAFVTSGDHWSWRHSKKFSGMNVLTLGIWYEGLMRWVGEAKSVLASGRIFIKERRDPRTGELRQVDIPDHLEVIAEMKCGATAQMTFSSVLHQARPPEVWLFGSEGTLCFDLTTEKLLGGKRGETELKEIPIPPEKQGHWRVEEDFIEAIRGKKKVTLTTFEEGVRYMAFTEAVHRSRLLKQLFLV